MGHDSRGKQQAFTLVELVVTVAILGVLSAVAIPQYLGVVDRSDRKAKVAETISVAKECAVLNLGDRDGSGVALTNPVSGSSGRRQRCGDRWPGIRFFVSQRFNSPGPVECQGESFTNARGVVVFVFDFPAHLRSTGARIVCRRY
ncbi:type IV pilin protein [Synechococcus sp. RSCCF101]|uniref:type IV pilin protein n=1 Tax=Synechococcus sp. RSCCF101 TaxID=2511069 RepID=UPI0017819129|nr:prepilin-type N-terminal cleavage/methylation domain-containing protein [Synechococcus sp. RSCCF101]